MSSSKRRELVRSAAATLAAAAGTGAWPFARDEFAQLFAEVSSSRVEATLRRLDDLAEDVMSAREDRRDLIRRRWVDTWVLYLDDLIDASNPAFFDSLKQFVDQMMDRLLPAQREWAQLNQPPTPMPGRSPSSPPSGPTYGGLRPDAAPGAGPDRAIPMSKGPDAPPTDAQEEDYEKSRRRASGSRRDWPPEPESDTGLDDEDAERFGRHATLPVPYGPPEPRGYASHPPEAYRPRDGIGNEPPDHAYSPPAQPQTHTYGPLVSAAPLPGRGAGIQEEVRRTLRDGLLGLAAPDTMQLGHVERVEVAIARTEDLKAELAAAFRTSSPRLSEGVKTADFMTVELISDDFTIKELSEKTQLLARVARWEYDVIPRRTGALTLTVRGSCVLHINGVDRAASIPSFEKQIHVDVDILFGVRSFAGQNWKWLVGTLIALAGLGSGIAAWIGVFTK